MSHQQQHHQHQHAQARKRTSWLSGTGGRRDRGGVTTADRRQRRASQFTATLKTRGGRVADGVARWFGVAGNDEDTRYRHMQYQQQVGRRRRSKQLTHSHGTGNLAQLQEVMGEDSSDSEYDADKCEHEMTRNVDEGLLHYRQLRDEENRKIVKPGWFGGEINQKRQSLADAGLGRRESKHRRGSKLRRNTLVAAQLESMPVYRPVFIELLCFLQVIIFLFLMAYAYTENQIAPFGLTNIRTVCDVDTSPPCELFNGTLALGTESVSKRNFMYGPTEDLLLRVGAKFAPCMRDDSELRRAALTTRALECGPDRTPENTCEGATVGAGCCTLGSGRKGMLLEEDCIEDGGTWENELCSSTDFVYLRPCCGVAGYGTCALTTENMCDFLGGSFQVDKVLCSEVLCLQPVCQLDRVGLGISADPDIPNVPSNPNQWYRFILSLFIHTGAVQVVFLMLVQWFIGRQIEKKAGVLRTFLIYFTSGICGNVIAAIFTPSQVTAGANPAVYGLLGCVVVELFQTWQIIDRPWLRFFKVFAIIIFFLMIGTTSYLDNWGHIGGFFFGVVAGILFLPYITFGKWDVTRKRILVLISFPLLISMIIMAFVTFYVIQNTDFCSWCKYLNCIPYHPDLPCDF